MELLRCLVCSMDMTPWSLADREAHLNACLDAASTVQRFDCPTCSQDLSHCDERRRTEHANRCLDRAEVSVGNAQGNGQDYDSESECAYVCKICGFDMSEIDLMRRIRHVKLCGQKFGVRPEDMGEVDQAETIGRRLEKKGEAPDAFAIMMKSSTRKEEASAAAMERSNVFDLLMRSSKTAAVLNARKRPVPFKFTRKAIQRRRLLYPDFKCIQGTDPPFIVDGFQYACKENSSIYFLTHFHSDHYGGLTKNFDCGIIYCNEITARLVVQELGVQSKYIHAVGMNTPVFVAGVQVTFMDANHCPGSAIILFRLKDGKTFLHTGDFRFNRKMLEYHALQSHIPTGSETIDHNGKIVGLNRLDGVYLDTTYCNPKYTFPTQQVAIDHALELIDKHFKQDKVLYLFGSYTIGKERLFMEIARKFQKKVCVSKTKLKIIETFGWHSQEMKLLTTVPTATNLHVVRMQDLQMDNLIVLLAKNRLRFHRIVAFRPTGWTFSGKNPRSISTCCTDPSGKIYVYGIPYSEHSSFAELCDFVQVVNPVSIIPTVLSTLRLLIPITRPNLILHSFR
ncbi:DNA cross-link repair protein, putative [Phytophthora infestans T30-4]|uniref:DNA cross-link repair protein, putative n=1 Tax=Phytophthora infestans (strain T30-4) TaxID=403677 RepID=D0NZJ1_PHYIT|nr:DNA cross-link repair protein, putative [Phytophthora infestans T30-4]EEY69548.1 DNA cross-link repair protein, putative [Phytophthora infestans T30-4]|eukprot:XP_002997225.1 DNA cross-link repair protein, putative [Phytophthora infestans T30-4]